MNIPKPLQRLYDLWMVFSRALGRVMSTILLTVFWIVAIGIYAIITKVVLLLRKSPDDTTYWIDVPETKKEDLLQQF